MDDRARVIEHYTRSPRDYRDWWEPALESLVGSWLDEIPFPSGAFQLLDLGCGSGLAGRRLAPRSPAARNLFRKCGL